MNLHSKQGHYHILSDNAIQNQWAVNQQAEFKMGANLSLKAQLLYSVTKGEYYASVTNPLLGKPFNTLIHLKRENLLSMI